MAKLSIKGNDSSPFGIKVFLDDKEIHHITNLDFNMSVDAINTVRIEMLVDDVEIDTEVKAWFSFRKGISV